LSLFCGIDWATEHHDVAIIDDDGRVVARARVANDAAGFAALLRLLAEAGDSAAHPIPVAIETDRGLWVGALRETGRVIYPINPLAASRYRARHAVSGAKSDATDAVLLANIIRTDADAHRPLPADTELAQAIRVLARAQQDAVWARQQVGNQIRDLLKDFYPAALAAFAGLPEGGLARADARTILADALAEAVIAHFDQHPDASIITSFPGLGMLAGARVLAEIGDDRSRFADARGLKAFAGSAPITRASGKKTVVLHRHIKNRRLAAVGPIWALSSLRASPGARRHFDARRTAGDWNHQAQRHLFNKFLGQLHHCLNTGQLYDEHLAFPPPLSIAA
jgi:transposase